VEVITYQTIYSVALWCVLLFYCHLRHTGSVCCVLCLEGWISWYLAARTVLID
jgi:hypothetical protein